MLNCKPPRGTHTIGAALAAAILSTALTGCWYSPPNPALDNYLKGALSAERGQLDEALNSLNKAIEKNPQLGLAFVARGDVYKQKGDYAKAAQDFEEATRIEPFNFNANYQLGLMYQYLKKYAESVRAYQKAVEIRPLDPEANMNLATVFVQNGEPLRGVSYAQRAVTGAPDDPNTHANLGILYAQLGYSELAVQSLKSSIELNSKQPEVYLNLAQEYIKASKFEQARQVLETARDIAPTTAIYERLGLVCYKLKRFADAREAYRQALQLHPDYFQALNGLGVIAMSQSLSTDPPSIDLAKEALGYWDRSLKIQPQQPVIQQLVNKYSAGK